MKLTDIMGKLEGPGEFLKRRRAHQAWWRSFVLDLPQGSHKGQNGERPVSSRIPPPQDGHWPNFVTQDAARIAGALVADRLRREDLGHKASGIVDEARLHTNLLSSQPLAVNFFGPLVADIDLANKVLRPLLGLQGRVIEVLFEFAPGQPTCDNSAFDVAVVWDANGTPALAGIEVKYTEPFSPTPARDRPRYQEVFEAARSHFLQDYPAYFTATTNQLWRSQMLAHALIQRHQADESQGFSQVANYVFFSTQDDGCRETVMKFQDMLSPSTEVPLKMVTMEDFIACAQTAELTWEQREWTMMLWARYLGIGLSDAALGLRKWEGHTDMVR